MIKIPVSGITIKKIIEDLTSKSMIICNARKWMMEVVMIIIAHLLITKLSNSIIRVVIRVNSAKNMNFLGKMLLIQTTRCLSNHFVLMANFVHSLTTSLRYQSNLSIKCRKIKNFIYMPIKQFGVRLLLITTAPTVFMLIIFKTIEEIQNNIIMNLFNVLSGEKMIT